MHVPLLGYVFIVVFFYRKVLHKIKSIYAGTVSSRRPSAAWDIWDKVCQGKKNVFE